MDLSFSGKLFCPHLPSLLCSLEVSDSAVKVLGVYIYMTLTTTTTNLEINYYHYYYFRNRSERNVRTVFICLV